MLIILAPLALSLWKRFSIQKETGNEATEFYHAQLATLERDYQANLLDRSHYDAAKIEIQRRLLNTRIPPPESMPGQSKGHFVIALSTLALIPLMGMVLYSINGVPFLPAQSARNHPVQEDMPASLLKKLADDIAKLTPGDADYAPKHILLGQIEEQMGLTTRALEDWHLALKAHFTPELALRIAETETAQNGHVTEEALALYHKALNAAPKNAPWRLAVEARIAAGEHEKDEHEKEQAK